jgi:hypothetical protein
MGFVQIYATSRDITFKPFSALFGLTGQIAPSPNTRSIYNWFCLFHLIITFSTETNMKAEGLHNEGRFMVFDAPSLGKPYGFRLCFFPDN